MANNDFNVQLEEFYRKIYSDLEDKTLNDSVGGYILQRLKTGSVKSYNKTQSETRDFDMSFLDVIESTYPALLKIMRDPKKSIRYEQEIVAVEKAKKINADTVRHLSSHTHLIKEIKNDNVIPAKVLTTYAEEELAIYENRFIKSLVKRVDMFLERRYQVMNVSLDSYILEHLNVSNDFLMSGKNVSVNLDIQIKEIISKNVEASRQDYERLVHVKELYQGLNGTDFMRALAKARDVFPPIMKTNILLHNPDFQMCYNLWLYLDHTDGISFGVDVKEKSYRFTEVLNNDLNEAMTLALTAFMQSRQLEGFTASKQKANIKPVKQVENKDIIEPLSLEGGTKQLEDYRMNEFLLSRTAAYYEASYDGMKRTGSTDIESLRVVYRQMLDMLDQIYPQVFNISDADFKSMDLYQHLEYLRKRQSVLRIVQKQKQMNIARMAKSIKKCDKDIEALKKRIHLKEMREAALAKKRKEKEAYEALSAEEKANLRKDAKEKIKRLIKETKKNEIE